MSNTKAILLITLFTACAGAAALCARVGDVRANSTQQIEASGRLEWDLVPSNGLRTMNTMRAKVLGGWLVTTQYQGGGRDSVGGMAFVPDPNHEWKISAPEENDPDTD